MFFKNNNSLSYVDSLKNIATNILKLLKTNDKTTNETIDKFIELIKNVKDEENMNKVRANIVKFSISYGDSLDEKKKQRDFMIKAIINTLSQIAKDYDNTKQWQEGFQKTRELLKNELTDNTLESINETLKNLIFSTKDTKELIYKDLASVIFNTLNIDIDQEHSKIYKNELLELKKEVSFNSSLLNTYPVREKLKKLVEKKEKLEEEYYNELQKKLNKAIKVLNYVTNTFSSDIGNYNEEFQSHIKQIDNLVSLEKIDIDVDEMSKRLIGIALKIKESSISMNEKIHNLSKLVEKSRETIENLQIKLKETQENLIIDVLTKVYNRRGLWHFLAYEIEKSKRYNTDFSIAMGDLDKFSDINNSYGHQVGDKVLETFAGTAKALTRGSDVITRYGGEEFIILLPESNIEQSYLFAEKIRKAIEALKFKYKDKEFNITVSFGVAQFKPNDTIETLIERVDKALYEAKKSRNKVVKEF